MTTPEPHLRNAFREYTGRDWDEPDEPPYPKESFAAGFRAALKPSPSPVVVEPTAMPTYGQIPWDDLRAAIAEATMGVADKEYFQVDPSYYIGHQPVSMNLNSLNRIVSKFAASCATCGHPVESGGELFEVRVAGPDDVLPFDNELDAHRCANATNKIYLADLLAHPGNEVLCVATVHPKRTGKST